MPSACTEAVRDGQGDTALPGPHPAAQVPTAPSGHDTRRPEGAWVRLPAGGRVGMRGSLWFDGDVVFVTVRLSEGLVCCVHGGSGEPETGQAHRRDRRHCHLVHPVQQNPYPPPAGLGETAFVGPRHRTLAPCGPAKGCRARGRRPEREAQVTPKILAFPAMRTYACTFRSAVRMPSPLGGPAAAPRNRPGRREHHFQRGRRVATVGTHPAFLLPRSDGQVHLRRTGGGPGPGGGPRVPRTARLDARAPGGRLGRHGPTRNAVRPRARDTGTWSGNWCARTATGRAC